MEIYKLFKQIINFEKFGIFNLINIFVDQVREPPTITGKFGPWSSHFFNLSMTYRRDAEIDNGWARIVPIESSQNREVCLHHNRNLKLTKILFF